MDRLSATSMVEMLYRGDVSARELAQEAVEKAQRFEPTLNAFVHLDPDAALASAAATDNARAMGQAVGKLAGVPTSVKDLIDVRGMNTTFGSRSMHDNMRDQDAPSVARLRAEGATILGKTTTTEFGCKAGGGGSPLTGITRNAWDPSKTPGGSSAGAAASVAAGVTPFAIGTDGGGSVRIPASLCGLFGIKAQFGRVPVYPVSATPTLAHVGVLSRSVADAALALEVMSGFEARDPFSVAADVPDWSSACTGDVEGMRILWSPTLGYAKPTAEILQATERTVRTLEARGARVEQREHIMRDPIELWMSEFYAGVGTRLGGILKSSPHLLDPAVADVLREAMGAQSLEEYYGRVFERFDLREQVRTLFDTCDLLLTPTLPVAAFDADMNVPPGYENRNMVSWVYYTYPFNLTGNPAASIPSGADNAGMPIGLQAVAATHREDNLFRVASAVELQQPWSYL
jgi:Asp-tRNA(Asn)/Glu-tRNA(Gln) amidotransferase A subunit family amidase